MGHPLGHTTSRPTREMISLEVQREPTAYGYGARACTVNEQKMNVKVRVTNLLD